MDGLIARWPGVVGEAWICQRRADARKVDRFRPSFGNDNTLTFRGISYIVGARDLVLVRSGYGRGKGVHSNEFGIERIFRCF